MQGLKAMYESCWPELVREITNYLLSSPKHMPTNPLLIDIDEDDYRSADIRIMIFGQETNDWYGEWGSKDLDQILKAYREFFCSGDCFKYGGHFFNGVSNYLFSIKQQFPDKKVSLVWNNLLKVGKASEKGTPPVDLVQTVIRSFPVIKQEIQILQPNLVIFFTGPNYDHYLISLFNSLKFEPINEWDTRKLARISANDLPIYSFRTYHPHYLWLNGYNRYKESIQACLCGPSTFIQQSVPKLWEI